ncbi:MAG: DUF1232 domain-containing protein [Synechococcales cyanobacterium C42_A2020_086]|jgi:uncharacterized membrane protein YkvA (DUF1232 family)|nr:DUF1232 domain-containing protein [Synechococcales cyanobacterium C42_A2020_086]
METPQQAAANTQPSFSEQSFWDKLGQFATQAGKDLVEKVLTLYFAAQRPETPMWAKLVIFSALAYFILPADVVPDFIPFTGYADDLSTIASAMAAVAMAITPEVKNLAKQQVQQWFGEETVAPPADTPKASDSIRVISIE